MPKELTHIMFAQEVAKRVSTQLSDEQVTVALQDFPEALYLGSVMVDSPLYALRSPEAAMVASIHHGNSPFSSIGGLVALSQHAEHHHYQTHTRRLALALLVGAILHRVLDINFHPWIFAITGANIEAHIALETALDGYMLRNYRKRRGVAFLRTIIGSGKIYQLIRKLRKIAPPSELDMLLSSYFEASFVDRYVPQSDSVYKSGVRGSDANKNRSTSDSKTIENNHSIQHQMLRILANHARIQRLFFSRSIRLGLRIAAMVLPRTRAYGNLCYSWKRATYGSIFKHKITYTHPSDGVYQADTVEELYHTACEHGFKTVQKLFDSIQSEKMSLSDTIKNWKLDNLCHGLDEKFPLHHNTAFYVPQLLMR